MATISKHEASQVEEMDGFEGHYEDLDGYTVGFETYTEDADPAPLFQGLPNDRCQCPHWGVVLTGTLIYNYGDALRTSSRLARRTTPDPTTCPCSAKGRRSSSSARPKIWT